MEKIYQSVKWSDALLHTEYLKTDPNVSKYNLGTYIGCPVYAFDTCKGSLCVVFQEDVECNETASWLIGIFAEAISKEEEKRFAEINRLYAADTCFI